MKKTGIFSSAIFGSLLVSLPALAEEGAKKGLPQLDASFYPDLLFWLVICFPLLFIVMRAWLVPAFQETQGNRRQILDTDLYAAKQASETAEQTRQEFEKNLAAARDEADKTVEGILADARKEAEQRNAALQKDLMVRVEAAEKKIATMKAETLKDAPRMADELARDIVNKVLSGFGAA